MRAFGRYLKIIAKSAVTITSESTTSATWPTIASPGPIPCSAALAAAIPAESTSETSSRKPTPKTIDSETKRFAR